MQDGLKAGIAILIAFLLTGFAGFLTSVSPVDTVKTSYDKVADLTPSVVASDVDSYEVYNPATNVTGWSGDAQIIKSKSASPYILSTYVGGEEKTGLRKIMYPDTSRVGQQRGDDEGLFPTMYSPNDNQWYIQLSDGGIYQWGGSISDEDTKIIQNRAYNGGVSFSELGNIGDGFYSLTNNISIDGASISTANTAWYFMPISTFFGGTEDTLLTGESTIGSLSNGTTIWVDSSSEYMFCNTTEDQTWTFSSTHFQSNILSYHRYYATSTINFDTMGGEDGTEYLTYVEDTQLWYPTKIDGEGNLTYNPDTSYSGYSSDKIYIVVSGSGTSYASDGISVTALSPIYNYTYADPTKFVRVGNHILDDDTKLESSSDNPYYVVDCSPTTALSLTPLYVAVGAEVSIVGDGYSAEIFARENELTSSQSATSSIDNPYTLVDCTASVAEGFCPIVEGVATPIYVQVGATVSISDSDYFCEIDSGGISGLTTGAHRITGTVEGTGEARVLFTENGNGTGDVKVVRIISVEAPEGDDIGIEVTSGGVTGTISATGNTVVKFTKGSVTFNVAVFAVEDSSDGIGDWTNASSDTEYKNGLVSFLTEPGTTVFTDEAYWSGTSGVDIQGDFSITIPSEIPYGLVLVTLDFINQTFYAQGIIPLEGLAVEDTVNYTLAEYKYPIPTPIQDTKPLNNTTMELDSSESDPYTSVECVPAILEEETIYVKVGAEVAIRGAYVSACSKSGDDIGLIVKQGTTEVSSTLMLGLYGTVSKTGMMSVTFTYGGSEHTTTIIAVGEINAPSYVKSLSFDKDGGTRAFIKETWVQLDPMGLLWGDPHLYTYYYYPDLFTTSGTSIIPSNGNGLRILFNGFVAYGNSLTINGVEITVQDKQKGVFTVNDVEHTIYLKGMAVDFKDGHVYLVDTEHKGATYDLGEYNQTTQSVIKNGVSTGSYDRVAYTIVGEGAWYWYANIYNIQITETTEMQIDLSKGLAGWEMSLQVTVLLFIGMLILSVAGVVYMFRDSEPFSFLDWFIIGMAIVILFSVMSL